MVPLSTSPLSTVARVSGWLQAHRRAHDVRPWQRAATCWVQAVLVLRWFKDDTKVHLLARDARVSQATAYRYLHEAVDVIADRAPELSDVLAPRPGARVGVRVPGRHADRDDPDQRSLRCRA